MNWATYVFFFTVNIWHGVCQFKKIINFSLCLLHWICQWSMNKWLDSLWLHRLSGNFCFFFDVSLEWNYFFFPVVCFLFFQWFHSIYQMTQVECMWYMCLCVFRCFSPSIFLPFRRGRGRQGQWQRWGGAVKWTIVVIFSTRFSLRWRFESDLHNFNRLE